VRIEKYFSLLTFSFPLTGGHYVLYANIMPKTPVFHFSTVFSAILPINVLTKPAQMK